MGIHRHRNRRGHRHSASCPIRTKARQKKVEQRFGPEYERKVEETGSPQAAVSKLREREKRRRALDIRPSTLPPSSAIRSPGGGPRPTSWTIRER